MNISIFVLMLSKNNQPSPPPTDNFWVDSNNENFEDSSNDEFIFSP